MDITTQTMIPVLALPEEPPYETLASLHFMPSGDYLFIDRAGGQTAKFVTAPDVVAAFSKRQPDTGWLPAGVVRTGYKSGSPFVVYSAPAQKYTVQFADHDAPLEIPLPRTVLLSYGDRKHKIWALGEKIFSPNAQAYHAPFPNVYSNGAICWGQNAPPLVDPQDARKAWQMFFDSAFNNHLSNGKSQSHPLDVRGLLRALAERKARKYPLDDLQFCGRTVGYMIDAELRE